MAVTRCACGHPKDEHFFPTEGNSKCVVQGCACRSYIFSEAKTFGERPAPKGRALDGKMVFIQIDENNSDIAMRGPEGKEYTPIFVVFRAVDRDGRSPLWMPNFSPRIEDAKPLEKLYEKLNELCPIPAKRTVQGEANEFFIISAHGGYYWGGPNHKWTSERSAALGFRHESDARVFLAEMDEVEDRNFKAVVGIKVERY